MDDLISICREIADAIAFFFHRLTIRSSILFVLLGLFIVWTGQGAFTSGTTLLDGFGTAQPYRYAQASLRFSLDLWGYIAGLVFGFIVMNPFAWLNGKRLIFGCIAFAMILGRLISGGLLFMGLRALLSQPLLFFVTPLALTTAGITVILAVFVTVMILFGCLVAVPAMLFNQILTFDNAVHVYRHQARGLAGYPKSTLAAALTACSPMMTTSCRKKSMKV